MTSGVYEGNEIVSDVCHETNFFSVSVSESEKIVSDMDSWTYDDKAISSCEELGTFSYKSVVEIEVISEDSLKKSEIGVLEECERDDGKEIWISCQWVIGIVFEVTLICDGVKLSVIVS